MNRASWLMVTLLLAAGCDAGTRPMIDVDAGTSNDDGSVTPPEADGGTTPTAAVAPGEACDCDSECEGTATHPGVCVQGICMQRASGDCASAGSSAECPAGSRCWGLDGVTGGVCWPDCDAHTCDGECDGDGSCIPSASSTCDTSCSAICSDGGSDDCPPNSHPDAAGDGCVCDEGYVVNADATACVLECTGPADCSGDQVCEDGRCQDPPCTPGSCDAGLVCSSSGDCVVDIGTPPPGPVPTCAAGTGTVPDWQCTGDASYCGELVPFDPDMGPGYWDYPLNGETETNQYRSYVRRDVMMLVKYATAMVDCQASEWTFGNGGPLGLGDMSEADGAIPGTSVGSPGHPEGTHVNGHDMDIAYYQTGTSDNHLRPVCAHTSGGEDAYHCTGEPTMLDPWRTALFLGHLHASPQLRVIGVDGRVGPLVDSALTQLCADGWVSGAACGGHSITWEETDMGRGWFYFHHHHLHISVSSP